MRLLLWLYILLCHGAAALAPIGWAPNNYERLQSLLDRPVSVGRPPVAAFDADGTLWSGDAYGAFASVLAARGLIDYDEMRRVEEAYGRSQGEERRQYLLESLALFRGLRLEQLHDAAEEAWGAGLRDTLRPEMADLVRGLRDRGWRVVIVTASPAEAVLRGARELGVPEGDVLALRLDNEGGVATGLPSPVMPLTWSDGKARALVAHGLGERLRLAAGNSMDDMPMIRLCRAVGGEGMLCVPRPTAAEDPWTGAAEGTLRLTNVAAAEELLLHEATSGPKEYDELSKVHSLKI